MFMSNCFNIVTQSKPHIVLMKLGHLYRVCFHGNNCATRTTHVLKSRYALCYACFCFTSVVVFIVLCLGIKIFVLFAPYVCFHFFLVKFV